MFQLNRPQIYVISNYRPISLLPILSKAIEKVVHEQTNKFLSDSNIFNKYQSGFRNNHSTDLFLSFRNDRILKSFDNGAYTGMSLIDLHKAFDTINHDKILLINFFEQTFQRIRSVGMNPIQQSVTSLQKLQIGFRNSQIIFVVFRKVQFQVIYCF